MDNIIEFFFREQAKWDRLYKGLSLLKTDLAKTWIFKEFILTKADSILPKFDSNGDSTKRCINTNKFWSTQIFLYQKLPLQTAPTQQNLTQPKADSINWPHTSRIWLNQKLPLKTDPKQATSEFLTNYVAPKNWLFSAKDFNKMPAFVT